MAVQVLPQMNVSGVGNALLNNSDIWKNLPPELSNSIGTMVTILKAVGIDFIIYLVFLIVGSILNIIQKKRIKEIQKKIFEIDKKLDKVLESKKKK